MRSDSARELRAMERTSWSRIFQIATGGLLAAWFGGIAGCASPNTAPRAHSETRPSAAEIFEGTVSVDSPEGRALMSADDPAKGPSENGSGVATIEPAGYQTSAGEAPSTLAPVSAEDATARPSRSRSQRETEPVRQPQSLPPSEGGAEGELPRPPFGKRPSADPHQDKEADSPPHLAPRESRGARYGNGRDSVGPSPFGGENGAGSHSNHRNRPPVVPLRKRDAAPEGFKPGRPDASNSDESTQGRADDAEPSRNSGTVRNRTGVAGSDASRTAPAPRSGSKSSDEDSGDEQSTAVHFMGLIRGSAGRDLALIELGDRGTRVVTVGDRLFVPRTGGAVSARVKAITPGGVQFRTADDKTFVAQ